jgi:hypothetical protein
MNSVSMSSFICTSMSGPTDSTHKSLLDADDEILCEDSIHSVYQVLSLIVVAVVGVAIPIGFGYKLLRKSRAGVEWRQALRVKDLAEELSVPEADVKSVAQQVRIKGYSFLMDTYKPSLIWWESLDMLRKLSYVGITLLYHLRSMIILTVILNHRDSEMASFIIRFYHTIHVYYTEKH